MQQNPFNEKREIVLPTTPPPRTPVVELLVPDCKSNQETLDFSVLLSSSLESKPIRLVLRFAGVHRIPSDPALIIYEALQKKSPDTELETYAMSSLMDGSALIWLTGQRRSIRSTAWLFFRKTSEVKNPWEREVPPELEEFYEGSTDAMLQEVDHRMVLRLASRYLPVSKLAGIPITSHMLAEFRLLEGQTTEGDASPEPNDSCSASPEKEICAIEPGTESVDDQRI